MLLSKRIKSIFYKGLALVVLLAIGFGLSPEANSKKTAFEDVPDRDYTFHTIMIYNFMRYTQWPEEVNDYVVSVLTNDPGTLRYFKRMAATRSSSSTKYEITAFDNPTKIPEGAHLVFIPEEKTVLLETVLQQLGDKPVLVVTEKSGSLKRGSGINFVMKNNKPYYELNKGAIEGRGLKVSQRLVDLSLNR